MRGRMPPDSVTPPVDFEGDGDIAGEAADQPPIKRDRGGLFGEAVGQGVCRDFGGLKIARLLPVGGEAGAVQPFEPGP